MTDILNCFFITPMGEKNSETDNRSKTLIKHFNELFIENDLPIKVKRTNQYAAIGIMTNNIQQQIIAADFVIADLTGQNPNVYYELGYAQACSKPIIQICSSDNFQLASDIGHIYTEDYNLDNEFEFLKFNHRLLKIVNGLNFDKNITMVNPMLVLEKVGEIEDKE